MWTASASSILQHWIPFVRGGWLRVSDFYEFLCTIALDLNFPSDFEPAKCFAFQFARPRLVEFLFVWRRPDGDAVVEELWRVFSNELCFDHANAVNRQKDASDRCCSIAGTQPENACFRFRDFGRPR